MKSFKERRVNHEPVIENRSMRMSTLSPVLVHPDLV